jgi:DnaJ-class molecular chaperone
MTVTDEKLIQLAREASAELRDPDLWEECVTCAGKGIAEDGDICPDCDGHGEIEI